MPAVSEAQRRAMYAAREGRSTLGIPKSVGEEFVGKDATFDRHASGVVFVAEDGEVLLLRRSPSEANFGGHWGLPGGGADEGESATDAAIRECKEEMGVDVDAPGMKVINRTKTPNGFLFTSFVKPVGDKFVPTLDHEHTGYAWASLDMLPQPLHPAVADLLGPHIGVTGDMKPEQWAELRENFAQWTREEEGEAEHAEDGPGFELSESTHIVRPKGFFSGSFDQKITLALDASVRSYDKDGRLTVTMANISKANVCPYWGHEIPGGEELGLDPDKLYQLLRSPEELERAAKTSNGVPLLLGHQPQSPDDHPYETTVGSIGTDADWADPYLRNSLKIWTREGIDAVESGEAKELSCGYHYRMVPTPGTFKGVHFDGVMVDIVFNHVALVPEGRAGADVVVGDSQIQPRETPMKKVLTRFAGGAVMALDLALQPKLAKDAKIDVSKFFEGVTRANFKDKKAQIATDIKAAARSKLAKDANLDDVVGLLDRMESCEIAEGADADPNSGLPMSAEDMEKAAKDAAEEEAKKEKEKKDAEDKAARDGFREKLEGEDMKSAFDALFGKEAEDESEEAKENSEGEEGKDAAPAMKPKGIDKKAMDAAIKKASDDTAARVKREMRDTQEAYQVAGEYVGKLALGMDSAEEVYRTALKGLGMDAKRVDAMHPDALRAVLESQPKPGTDQRQVRRIANDAAVKANEGFETRWGSDSKRFG